MNSFLASSGSSGSNRMAVSYLFGVILRSCLLSADRAPGRFAGSKEYVSPRGVRRGRATLVFLARPGAAIHNYGCIRGPLHPSRLRCAPSPYLPSTPRSRRLAGYGASALSVRHRTYEPQHLAFQRVMALSKPSLAM